MTVDEKVMKCKQFFDDLVNFLSDKGYTVVEGCTKGISVYLVPEGTEDEITWYGKPVGSFRYSVIWNWYSPLEKCSDPSCIQCESVDMPEPRERYSETAGSRPFRGPQVAFYGRDGKYHHIYGSGYNRKTERWYWNEDTTVEDVEVLLKYGILG